jgi:uroporphyrinogen-III synthase
MTRPIVVMRPQPGCAATASAANKAGLDAIEAPLFAIEPVQWSAPDPSLFDGILAGSANAFRCGGNALAALTALPVHAVGEHTAQAALEAGFAVATSGEGGLQGVLDRIPAPVRLLRLAGEARVALRAPAGIEISERVVYRSAPLALSPEGAALLGDGAVALLHSAEAARHFADECDRLAIDRSRIAIAALGPRIAAAAGEGWQSVASADRPADDRLLALAERLCQ